jgi:uracil-DNA glycosylase family protein
VRAKSLTALRREAATCTRCDLYKNATQTVFGEGAAGAAIVLVGEQPGDAEDVAGRPFVGPAGRLLDKALADAGIARRETYVTNAVKHFKFIIRGKKRLHQKPNAIEVEACLPWLESEIAAVKPAVVVLLGATAAQAVMGRSFRVTKERGKRLTSDLAPAVIATVHPSSLLRMPDRSQWEREYARFVADLKVVAKAVKRNAA